MTAIKLPNMKSVKVLIQEFKTQSFSTGIENIKI